MADQGIIDGMLGLGWYFRNGADSRMNAAEVARDKYTDYEEAIRWYSLAADKGSAEAMFSLGYMYHKGITPDLKEDHVKAEYWYERAIAQGNSEATKWLELLRDHQ